MSQQRSRLSLAFKPQGIEKDVPFLTRARFAMLGANQLHSLDPETQPELHEMLEAVSQKAGMAAPKAFIWDSKKPVANAVAMPANPPIVAFSKTITEILNPQELAAVAGHELGHVKNMGHSGKMFWLSAFGAAAITDLVARPLQKMVRNEAAKGTSSAPVMRAADSVIFAGRMLSPLVGIGVASRAEEYAADRHGAYTMEGDAAPLMSALEKLTQHNHNPPSTTWGKMKEGMLKPFFVLTRSHPTFENRRIALGVTNDQILDYRAAHGDNTHMHASDGSEIHPLGSPKSGEDTLERAGEQTTQEAQAADAAKWQDRLQQQDESRGNLER